MSSENTHTPHKFLKAREVRMHDLVARVRRYATEAHSRINHRRKYSFEPYDVHLRDVAGIVATVTDDPDTIAAWLHDVVEDTPASFLDIEREFGPTLAALVEELRDVSRPADGNRAARKAMDRAHLAGASSRAKTVKLADLIDNCRDICRQDPEFARVFLQEMASLLEVLGDGDQRLHKKASAALMEREGHRVLGIRRDGKFRDYALREDPLSERPFRHGQIVGHDACFSEVIMALSRRARCGKNLDERTGCRESSRDVEKENVKVVGRRPDEH